MMGKSRNSLTGVSGEYFVAAELSRLGFIASISLRNTRGIDILCSNSEATKHVSIQVKTTQKSNNSWILDQKSEEYFSPTHFYVFVSLKGKEEPRYFIVPSKIVASYLKKDYQRWIEEGKRLGKKRGDTSVRKFTDIEEKYLNRWDLLGL